MIEVEIDDQEVLNLLAALKRKLGDLTPAMATIGEAVRSSVQRNFRVGGRPASWKPVHREGQILVDTGRLKNSFAVRPQADRVSIGTNVKYAVTHQFGAKRGAGTVRAHTRRQQIPWGNIPARPFMLVQPEDWSEIGAALNDFLTGGVK